MKPTTFKLIQLATTLDLPAGSKDDAESIIGNFKHWPELLRQAELYGISNLLLRHIRQHQWSVPKDVVLALKALELRHRHAADARYRLMQRLQPAFAEQGIELVALKGLALAPMLYPADHLRPMRDIDVLVPREKQQVAGELLKQLGFDLPDSQPSKYMRDSHQLPNATINVQGFTISVEIHHDALSRDVPGSLFFDEVQPFLQTVQWRELDIQTLGHEQMLHQVCRHLAGLHPGAVLKMINVLDIVLYAEKFRSQINWQKIDQHYSHVTNTLKCLHLITPLSPELLAQIGPLGETQVSGVGETMQPLSKIIAKRHSLKQQLSMLLFPPDWWMHLYYNVSPDKSLMLVRTLRHPLQIGAWLAKRFLSRILGG